MNLIVPADVAMGGPPFVLPGNLSSIGHSNFDHCAGLAAIITAAANPHYPSLNGVLFNKSKTKFTQNPAGYRWRRAVAPRRVAGPTAASQYISLSGSRFDVNPTPSLPHALTQLSKDLHPPLAFLEQHGFPVTSGFSELDGLEEIPANFVRRVRVRGNH